MRPLCRWVHDGATAVASSTCTTSAVTGVSSALVLVNTVATAKRHASDGAAGESGSSSSLLSPSAGSSLNVVSAASQQPQQQQQQLILSRIKSVRRPSSDETGDTASNSESASSAPSARNRPGASPSDFVLEKAKKKAPWGAMQLKDSWSVDAMSKKGDYDNMNERMHREYRYHPHELQRRTLKWVGLSVIPMFVFGMAAGYRYHTGEMLWRGDPQYVLNFIRSADCSPRSKFYPFRMEGCDELPEHITRYRQEQKQRLEAAKAEEERQAQEAKAALDAAIHRHRQVHDASILTAAAAASKDDGAVLDVEVVPRTSTV